MKRILGFSCFLVQIRSLSIRNIKTVLLLHKISQEHIITFCMYDSILFSTLKWGVGIVGCMYVPQVNLLQSILKGSPQVTASNLAIRYHEMSLSTNYLVDELLMQAVAYPCGWRLKASVQFTDMNIVGRSQIYCIGPQHNNHGQQAARRNKKKPSRKQENRINCEIT